MLHIFTKKHIKTKSVTWTFHILRVKQNVFIHTKGKRENQKVERFGISGIGTAEEDLELFFAK